MSKANSLEAVKPGVAAVEITPTSYKKFHWSMRIMSGLSLLTLGLYSYVLQLCQREARRNAVLRQNGQTPVFSEATYRVRLASLAFSLDLLVSAYFSAVTPVLLKQGGLVFNRKTMPRPLFWFFAVTGFVPTASMTFTVLLGRRWQARIRQYRAWRTVHGLIALLAYFSWWIACAPVFFVALVGEQRTLVLLQALNRRKSRQPSK